MKSVITLFAFLLVAASAFTVPVPASFAVRSTTTTSRSAPLFSDKKDDEEEGGLDLDLGEMFEMFEAADKEENFDDTIKKVKADEK